MPDEYISREAALMKLMQDGCSAKNLQSISDMPAADVAEVARYRNCIYRIDGRRFSRTSFLNSPAVKPDNFCSWGATE